MDIANIPVIQKSPVTGLQIQQLFVDAGFSDPITSPNGALILYLGQYTQGSIKTMSTLLANGTTLNITIHDFTIEPTGTLLVSVWGNQNSPVTTVDVLTVNESTGTPIPVGTWDVIVLIFDLDGPPVVPGFSISDHIVDCRAAVIARDALIIN